MGTGKNPRLSSGFAARIGGLLLGWGLLSTLLFLGCSAGDLPLEERVGELTQAFTVGDTIVLKSNRSSRFIVLNGTTLNWSGGTTDQNLAPRFATVPFGAGFKLKALSTGKYVKVDSSSKKLRATETTATTATAFVTEACGSKKALLADKNGDGVVNSNDHERYVKANDDVEARASSCDPNSSGSWEKWDLVDVSPPSLECGEAPLSITTAVASSSENSAKTASKAIDDNLGTRWSSQFSDPQWIYVDLGTQRFIRSVTLRWENAASAHYDIQVSDDASTWTTVFSEPNGNGGVDQIEDINVKGRYVRMFSHARTTQYGNSLWELDVFGDTNPSCFLRPFADAFDWATTPDAMPTWNEESFPPVKTDRVRFCLRHTHDRVEAAEIQVLRGGVPVGLELVDPDGWGDIRLTDGNLVTKVDAPAGSYCMEYRLIGGEQLIDGARVMEDDDGNFHVDKFKLQYALLTPAPGAESAFTEVRARWVLPSGQPFSSFSYGPAPGMAMSLSGPTGGLAKTARPTRKLQPGHLVPSLRDAGQPERLPFAEWKADPQRAAKETSLPPSASGGIVALAVPVPNEEPTPSFALELLNTSDSQVAFSIQLRETGFGNFSSTTVVQAPQAAVSACPNADPGGSVLCPDGQAGSSRRYEITDLPSRLVIKPTDMPARADWAVGLHHVTAGAIDPTPYGYLGVESFYYNFSADGTQVFTYSMQSGSQALAPAGMEPKLGLIERYDQSYLGSDDLFAPSGTFGTVTAQQAQQDFMNALPFPGRQAFALGYRLDVHDAGAVPPVPPSTQVADPVIPPAGTPGAPPAAFNPADGPTTFCMQLPSGFVDNGSEAFPEDLPDPTWLGIHKFSPASFAYGELFSADGVVRSSVYLDENGCLPPLELGAGNYYFRYFTEMADTGLEFRVLQQEEPVLPLDGKLQSVTLAIFLRNPGGTILAANAAWSKTTNLAATACTTLRKAKAGVDMGLVRNPTTPTQYVLKVNVPNDSFTHRPCNQCIDGEQCRNSICVATGAFYLPDEDALYTFPSFEEWTHDARWKFVIGHELGHMIEDFSGAVLGAPYSFNQGTDDTFVNNGLNAKAADPVSAASLPGCNCNAVNNPLFASHCLQSMEISEAAQTEAIGHLFSSRIWNRTPTETDYDGSCTFNYYKYVNDPALRSMDDGIPPVPFDCANAYAHRNNTCDMVNINGFSVGGEADWLTFYWSVTTDSTAPGPIPPSTLLRWYKQAGDRLPSGSGPIMTYQLLRAEAVLENAAFGPWLDAKAAEHAVD
jgi:hypothetical protein